MVDAGCDAEVEMLIHNFTGNRANVVKANTGVIFTLWAWEAFFRPAERAAILAEEILLLVTKPGIVIIEDGSAHV